MSKFNTKALCRIAMLAALYVLLNNTIAIKAGNLRITFASLPVVLSALLFGPVESALTALLGEFINQPLTATSKDNSDKPAPSSLASISPPPSHIFSAEAPNQSRQTPSAFQETTAHMPVPHIRPSTAR